MGGTGTRNRNSRLKYAYCIQIQDILPSTKHKLRIKNEETDSPESNLMHPKQE